MRKIEVILSTGSFVALLFLRTSSVVDRDQSTDDENGEKGD